MEIRGDIVKQLRIDKGWTQAQLAEICDVNLRTIQRVENKGNASLETIMALCVSFDVKRQALFKVPAQSEINAYASNQNGKHATLPNIKGRLLLFILGTFFGSIVTVVIFLFLHFFL